MCFDIKKIYLCTLLDQLEYMHIQLSAFPEHIIKHYNLREKALNVYIFVEIRISIYGLPQAVALTNKCLKVNLAAHGYFESPHTSGIWRHITRPISFSLVVENFGVKYINKADADHLISALKDTMKYHKTGQVDYTVLSH